MASGAVEFEEHFEIREMREAGMIKGLEYFSRPFPPNGLKAFFEVRPSNLRILEGYGDHTANDYLALLDFLEHPQCKLERLRLYSLHEVLSSLQTGEHDDERLENPLRSFINVIRDGNSTLRHVSVRFDNEIRDRNSTLHDVDVRFEEGLAEIKFWCGMNETCPNRLKLRQQLGDSYADQIATYTNNGSHSQAFELIRSTFHLWVH